MRADTESAGTVPDTEAGPAGKAVVADILAADTAAVAAAVAAAVVLDMAAVDFARQAVGPEDIAGGTVG